MNMASLASLTCPGSKIARLKRGHIGAVNISACPISILPHLPGMWSDFGLKENDLFNADFDTTKHFDLPNHSRLTNGTEPADDFEPVTLPTKMTNTHAVIQRPIVNGVVTPIQVDRAFDAITTCRAAISQFVEDGHDLGSEDFKRLSNKLIALHIVAGVDAKTERANLSYLAKVSGWNSQKNVNVNGAVDDTPDGVDELLREA